MSRRGNIITRSGQEHRQELVKLLKKAAYTTSAWRIWDDLMFMSAAALAQPLNFQQEREDEYLRRINHYDKPTQDLLPALFSEIALALEQEGCYDVLGEIYMEMELNNHWKGQFFTPFHVSLMMAKMSAGNAEQEIAEKGFITVGDPCCGGGAMLIAFAKSCQEQGVNYQKDVLFIGQDIDPVVARMCYVQMSLLGMSGYVTIGNSLIQEECTDVWYTPFYFLNGFQYRKQRIVAENSDKYGKNLEPMTEMNEIAALPKVIKPDIEIFRENASGQFELIF